MAENCNSESSNLVIAIGGSAGSLKEIVKILSRLPEDFQACVVVATHRAPTRPNILATVLGFKSRVEVTEPQDEECLECMTVYVGAPDDTVKVSSHEFRIESDPEGKSKLRRIDDLFSGVAKSARNNAVGVILSGMLYDGVQGLKDIHDAGGRCIVQDPTDAEYDSMPNKALAKVPADFVGTADEIADLLIEIARGRECQQ